MNRKTVIRLSLIIIIGMFSILLIDFLISATSQSTTWEKINQKQMVDEIEQDNVQIVDLREPELYAKGHIPRAINIPFVEFEERYQELEKDKRIVFVCHTGPMGDASSQFLLEKGYENIANLTGGMAKWQGSTVNK